MRLPRIGVMCSTALMTTGTGRKATIDGMYVEFGEVLSQCGTIPILIPLGVSCDVASEYLRFLHGIILTGGPDIGAVSNDRFEPLKGGLDPRKDLLEWRICSLALSCGIPLLGVCRGLQMINVYLGGNLYGDIPTDCPSAVVHDTPADEPAAEHTIKIAPASKLSSVFQGSEGRVNSYHHQAVKRLAPALRGTAWSEDGLIEGVESVIYRSLLGVQFHPELDYDSNEASMNVFRWLVEEANRFMALKEGENQAMYWEERVG